MPVLLSAAQSDSADCRKQRDADVVVVEMPPSDADAASLWSVATVYPVS
jgi:hypothetical protein